MKRVYSAPTSTNLELTEACNVKCTHCYNFWREDSMGGNSLTIEKLDVIIDKLIDAGVFHIVLTGGEPFAKFKLLTHGLQRLKDAQISASVNTNLMLATDEKCKILSDLGLDHVLTSLPSSDPVINDQIMQKVGAFELIMDGIAAARRNNIRVSVNHVVSLANYKSVYETAKKVAEVGGQKIFITKAVPPTYSKDPEKDGYITDPAKMKETLDAALQAKADFGISIGTLVSYPLCFLGDLEKYKDFIGRGCPGQRGTRFSVNSTGETHACVHEEKGYGNLFENSVKEVYANMSDWHDGSLRYVGCKGCRYADICESGCRMASLGFSGSLKEKDPLYVGPDAFTKHYELDGFTELKEKLNAGEKMKAPKRLKFRDEDGFVLLNIRWGNTISIPTELAAKIKDFQVKGEIFKLSDFEEKHRGLVVGLVLKDALETPHYEMLNYTENVGLSLNLEGLEIN